MNARTKFILGSTTTVAVVVIAFVVASQRQPAATDVAKVQPVQPAAAQAAENSTLPAAAETSPPVQIAKSDASPVAKPQKADGQPAPKANGKEPVQDPDARVALSLVGADPDAESYWLGAIFDTSLPDQEREDLMEDLNEDGLSDPKHPGPQDLPLILNRLALIEEIAPSADPFMQEHLGEAYKDLNNLLAGKPVQ